VKNKIEIGFLASSFVFRYGSGTGKHFYEIIKILCTKFNSSVQVNIFCNTLEQFNYLSESFHFSNAKLILFPNVKGNWLKSSRQYFRYAFHNNKIRIDVLHFTVPRFYPFFWLFPAKKFVCTFHAAGDITTGMEGFEFARRIYNLTAKIFFKKLDGIIAVSEFARNEIETAYGIPRNLISVMHVGTDDIWKFKSGDIKYSVDDRYLVVVIGRWQKFKNVQLVAKTLALAAPSDLESYFFIFVGKKISSNVEVIEQQLNLVKPNFYKTIDYLTDENYAALIMEADLVIVPSLNEGFCHPVFDAFSLGTKVLFHAPSPAEQILGGRKGVFTADLRTPENLLNLIGKAIEGEEGNYLENRNYLESIEATWDSLATNYVNLYKKLNE
jgi:glycosyltransferase involved in cell wall biosynthesis